MTLGTIVYLAWYDFQKQTEHLCKGEVVDNSLWAGTKQADMINVRFQAPGMSAPICHHFAADRLSMTDSEVPHDECYLACGKKTRSFEHDATIKKVETSDAWQQVQQFKQEHWDYEHGHLSIDVIDEFYQLWRDAIAAKRGYQSISAVAEAVHPTTHLVSDEQMEELKAQLRETFKKPTAKQKRSTGRIQFQDAIQTSIFD